MSVYLKDIPLSEAKHRFLSALKKGGVWTILGSEILPLDENVVGRVVSEPIWAKISSPHYHASAMDGFAVRSVETTGAQETSPVLLHIGTEAAYLDTGDPIPVGFDAVIPIENVEPLNESGVFTQAIRNPTFIRIRSSVTPWSQIRPLGEDIVQTQLVLPSGQVLRPVDLGAIAAAGHVSVKVARRPRVAILPTGSELVPIGSNLKPGDILEYNSIVIAAQVKAWGGEPKRYPITLDNLNAICARVEEAARDNDLILLNAGSSAGAEDFSAQVVEELGTLLVHGIAVRPGHPVILGMIKRKNTNRKSISPPGVPIIGVPGYPVSAALTCEIFVEPLIARWTGRQPQILPVEEAILTRKITSPAGDDDYIRVTAGRVGDRLLVTPLARGAGVMTSLVRADGLVVLPRGVQGASSGDKVPVHLYRSHRDLERTILCIGSHDMTLDLLGQFLGQQDRRFVSANVGSLGGLVALNNGECHLAGSHLLDIETGEYNISYIRQYLRNLSVKVYGYVGREQGLIVRSGNPKKVKDLQDLLRDDIFFINRQRGAGTRILLDYELSKLGMTGNSIQGYNQEEYTHLGVAAAVASGRADCGLGIPSAAHSLNLDFIPLYNEIYHLIIPKVFAESELLEPLLDTISKPDFQNWVASMPGYDVSHMGELIKEI